MQNYTKQRGPEVTLSVVLSADWLVVLQLLEHHGAAAGRGRALLGLGGSQWALADLASGQKTHQPRASLLSHCDNFGQSVQICNCELTGVSEGANRSKSFKSQIKQHDLLVL